MLLIDAKTIATFSFRRPGDDALVEGEFGLTAEQIEQINRRDPEDPVVGLTIQLTVTRVRPMIDKGDEL